MPPRDALGRFLKGYHYSPETERKRGTTQGFQKGNKLALGNKHRLGKGTSDKQKAIVRAFFINHNPSKNRDLTGENNSNWKGGKTKPYKHYNNKEYTNWRKQVFERDDYTCVECGIRGTFLHPHHQLGYTKFPEHRFDINNGVTLCVECHRDFHFPNRRRIHECVS